MEAADGAGVRARVGPRLADMETFGASPREKKFMCVTLFILTNENANKS